MTGREHREHEWQFESEDLGAVRRWLESKLSEPGSPPEGAFGFLFAGADELTDVYLDTPPGALYAAGWALRHRMTRSLAPARPGGREAERLRRELTLKSTQSERTDAVVRREISEALAPTDDDALDTQVRLALAAAQTSRGEVGTRVREMAETRELRPFCLVVTARRRYALESLDGPCAEVALDETSVLPVAETESDFADGPPAVAQPVDLRRVEVELAPRLVEPRGGPAERDRQAIEAFVERLGRTSGLVPARASKLEVGLRAAGRSVAAAGVGAAVAEAAPPIPELARRPAIVSPLVVPTERPRRAGANSPSAPAHAPGDVGPTEVADPPSATELAYATLRRLYLALRAHEAGTRAGVDAEELHQMRVATRRTRAALSFFAPALPERSVRYRAAWRRLGRAMGRLRDLDVQCLALTERIARAEQVVAADPERMDAFDAISPDASREILARLEKRRRRVRERLIARLDRPTTQSLFRSYERFLSRGETGTSEAGAEPATSLVPDRLRRRRRKLRRALRRLSPSSTFEQFHVARIQGKRLRYAVEFAERLYGDAARAYARRLVPLQDVLGQVQDAVVAMESWSHPRLAETLGPGALLALGRMFEQAHAAATAWKKRIRRQQRRVKGRAWRALRREMSRHEEMRGTVPRRTIPPRTPVRSAPLEREPVVRVARRPAPQPKVRPPVVRPPAVESEGGMAALLRALAGREEAIEDGDDDEVDATPSALDLENGPTESDLAELENLEDLDDLEADDDARGPRRRRKRTRWSS